MNYFHLSYNYRHRSPLHPVQYKKGLLLMRPNNAEEKYLTLAYNAFYDIFDEILTDSFWGKDRYYKFCRIKDAFSVYAELLNYPPIQSVIEYLKNNRPPMEAEIGSELFKFVRNVVAHFPFFGSWEDIWIDQGYR